MRQTKLFMTCVALLSISFISYAGPGTSNGDDLLNPGSRCIYYGTKASKNSDNPCRGATIRVCAIIETTTSNDGGSTTVLKVVKDADGNIVNVTREYVAKSLSEVIIDTVSQLPANAEVEEVNF